MCDALCTFHNDIKLKKQAKKFIPSLSAKMILKFSIFLDKNLAKNILASCWQSAESARF